MLISCYNINYSNCTQKSSFATTHHITSALMYLSIYNVNGRVNGLIKLLVIILHHKMNFFFYDHFNHDRINGCTLLLYINALQYVSSTSLKVLRHYSCDSGQNFLEIHFLNICNIKFDMKNNVD